MSDLSVDSISTAIAAIAALGTSAFGLVDAAKVFWGGPSRFGFGYIRKALDPFSPALAVVGKTAFFDTLLANWMNGVPEDQQKAKAKALIHLGLIPSNAKELATAAGVDVAMLTSAATNIDNGMPLTPNELTLLGRFDAIVSAKLDEAFERADQTYRNSAKALSCVVAVVLAVTADYLSGWPMHWGLAALLGLVSTPLAPIAKDLTSSLAAAASVVGSPKK